MVLGCQIVLVSVALLPTPTRLTPSTGWCGRVDGGARAMRDQLRRASASGVETLRPRAAPSALAMALASRRPKHLLVGSGRWTAPSN